MAPPTNGADPKDAVKVEIHTESRTVGSDQTSDGPPPEIKMNGKALPAPAGGMKSPHGYLVVVIDAAMDMTDPGSIVANEYHYLPRVDGTWANHYEGMYRSMIHPVRGAGDPARQRVFIVSF